MLLQREPKKKKKNNRGFIRGLIFVIHISINEIDAIIGLKDDLVPCLDCQNAKQKKDWYKDGKSYLVFPGKCLT